MKVPACHHPLNLRRIQNLFPHLPMPQSLKIAAVFATMNRAQPQWPACGPWRRRRGRRSWWWWRTMFPADGTVAALEALTDLPFELVVHQMRENRGNAGGVEEAMELAFARGADAVWILDDDSWPRPRRVAAMLEKPWDPGVVRHAAADRPADRPFHLAACRWLTERGGWRLVDSAAGMPPGNFVRSRITWTGALVPREVRRSGGAGERRVVHPRRGRGVSMAHRAGGISTRSG